MPKKVTRLFVRIALKEKDILRRLTMAINELQNKSMKN